MRAHDLLDALDRVTEFRAQAADSNRRVEDIGSDLDSAISLLDLRQSREGLLDAVGTSATTSDLIYSFFCPLWLWFAWVLAATLAKAHARCRREAVWPLGTMVSLPLLSADHLF